MLVCLAGWLGWGVLNMGVSHHHIMRIAHSVLVHTNSSNNCWKFGKVNALNWIDKTEIQFWTLLYSATCLGLDLICSAPQTLDGQRELPEKSAMRYGQLVGAIAVRMVVLQFGPRHTGGRQSWGSV